MSLTLYERVIGFYDISDDELTESYYFLKHEDIEKFFRRKKFDNKINPNFIFSFKENYFIKEYFSRNVEEDVPFPQLILDYLSSPKSKIKEHFRDFKELFPLENVVEQAVLEGKLNYDNIIKNSFKSKVYDILEVVSNYFFPINLGFLFSYFSLNQGFDFFSLQTIIGFPLGFFLGRELFSWLNEYISDYFLFNNPNYFFVEENFIGLHSSLDLILYYSTVIESLLF